MLGESNERKVFCMAEEVAVKPAKQKLSGRQYGVMAAILVMYFFAPTFTAVSATFAEMPAVFGVNPADVSWLNGTSNILACIAGLFIGTFVGKRISYRAAAILATALFTIFGSLPFWWQDIPWGALVASRTIFGFGFGCFNPLTQAILTHMVKSETARAAWIGICNIVFSCGATFGSMICGALGLVSWQTAYLFYAFCVVALICCIIFVRDKDIVGEKEMEKDMGLDGETPPKRSLPAVAISFIVIFVFCTLLTTSFFSYLGIAMAESGADTLLVGTVLSIFTVAGIVTAALNAPLWKLLRLWNFPLSYLFIAVSYIVCLLAYSTGSTALFFVASIVMGIGCCLCGMVMPMVMSVTVMPAALTLAIGLQEVARNLGGVFSSFFLTGVGATLGDNPVTQFTASAVLGFVIMIAAGIVAAKYNKKFKNVDMEEKEK